MTWAIGRHEPDGEKGLASGPQPSISSLIPIEGGVELSPVRSIGRAVSSHFSALPSSRRILCTYCAYFAPPPKRAQYAQYVPSMGCARRSTTHEWMRLLRIELGLEFEAVQDGDRAQDCLESLLVGGVLGGSAQLEHIAAGLDAVDVGEFADMAANL